MRISEQELQEEVEAERTAAETDREEVGHLTPNEAIAAAFYRMAVGQSEQGHADKLAEMRADRRTHDEAGEQFMALIRRKRAEAVENDDRPAWARPQAQASPWRD